ncbi:uncharacterized protein [Dermacentor andersoni]|uniref:uncharacterized protein isoform X2 n=1 Tax=Dermacentor andersoni TaxID=34620 RepID=UPI002416C470|nr:uncharacterized protein LOC129380717 isoform X2 [Dermacentor andersoni]
MSLGTPKTQTAYLALLGEVLQQPGHHYIYHNETQYKTEQRFSIMSDIGAGFTARAFYYNKDNRRRRVCDDHLQLPQGYLNKHLLHTGSVEKIPGYTWQLTLQNEHQKLLSVHLTFEEPPDTLKLSDYWGTKSYLENQWVPIGTVGVFECALVDKSAPHWLKITDSQGYEQQVEFQSGSLTQDSELCYNIRLSPVAYIVTTSFDYTSKTIYDSSGAYYIRVKFSPAVYIKRYDMKIPYFTPY